MSTPNPNPNPTWTKQDQALLDALTRRKEEFNEDIRQRLYDFLDLNTSLRSTEIHELVPQLIACSPKLIPLLLQSSPKD